MDQAESYHNVGAIDWGSIIKDSVSAATDIFKARYGVPPSGTVIYQKTPDTVTQVYRIPGVGVGVFPSHVEPVSPVSSYGDITILLLILVVAVALSGKGDDKGR